MLFDAIQPAPDCLKPMMDKLEETLLLLGFKTQRSHPTTKTYELTTKDVPGKCVILCVSFVEQEPKKKT